jgi:hypothetical protein
MGAVGMRAICGVLALAFSIVALAGCETLADETIVSSDVKLRADSGPMAGALIRSDLTQDLLGGLMYRYRAVNYSSVPVCARASLISTSASNYSFGDGKLVPSGATVDLGYADDGSTVEYDLWPADASGSCGYRP